MITLRRAEERGHFDHGWLNTRHTFSFADYYDPKHMGFRDLRVINDDLVAPGEGFGEHPHRDMEILTYILEGALEHKDSMGNGSVIRPGDVQRMSAGTGVTHSEFNPSPRERVHLLQIWILPEKRGAEPGYEQKHFTPEERRGRLRLVASRDGQDGSVTINQDSRIYATLLDQGQSVSFENAQGRHAWLHLARGEAKLNGETLRAGDGVAITGKESLTLTAGPGGAEALVFDLR
jgi:hypothetical protein